MGPLHFLYKTQSEQTTPDQAAEERLIKTDISDIIARAKEEERCQVYTQFDKFCGLFGAVYFLSCDGTIYKTGSIEFETKDQAANKLKEVKELLTAHNLSETPVNVQFMPGSGHVNVWFDYDYIRNPNPRVITNDGNKQSYQAWLREIQEQEGILAYAHLQTAKRGIEGKSKMNVAGYNAALFDFATPTLTHLITRLPEGMTLEYVLKEIPKDIKKIDFAPFILYNQNVWSLL